MESLSDIEEELRDLSRSAEYCELQPTVNGMTISAYFANLADRIAAIDSADAWRSLYTPGNAAAMREALERFMGWYNITSIRTASLRTIAEAARAALAAPARQCDVGTADEQDARFGEFCVMRRTGSCAGCPDPVGGFTVANGIRECPLVWAQTPYKEGARK